MTNPESPPQTEAVVLRDSEGDYYLIPRELLAHLRVREEQRAEIEALLAQSEVHGFGGAYGTAGTFPGIMGGGIGDIQAIAFIVMMQSSKSMNSDLKAIMRGVKNTRQRSGWPPS